MFAQRFFRVGIGGQWQLDPLGNIGVFERFRVFENARQRVVIARRNRIELVIVTARAADRLAEQRLADHVELLIDDIHHELIFVLLLEVVISQNEKRGRDHLAPAICDRIGREQIARDLLAHKTVEGPILIETLDHVIAVAPRLLEHEAAQRERFAEARDVEPVPAPALAETRRREQPIHEPLVGRGRAVIDERVDLLGRRRQAGQIVSEPANQRDAISIGDGANAAGFLPREDEAVEVAARPRGVGDRRQRGRGDGAVRPMFAAFLEVDHAFDGDDGRAGARIGRAEFHPFFEVGDLLVAQAALGRHAEILVAITHGLDQAALVEIAGNQRRAAVAAVGPALARVEPQAALGLRLRAVTLEAMRGEQRADPLLKKLEAGGIGRRRGCLRGDDRRGGGRGGRGTVARDATEHDVQREGEFGFQTHGITTRGWGRGFSKNAVTARVLRARRRATHASLRPVIDHEHLIDQRADEADEFLVRGMRQIGVAVFLGGERERETVRAALVQILGAVVRAPFKRGDFGDFSGQRREFFHHFFHLVRFRLGFELKGDHVAELRFHWFFLAVGGAGNSGHAKNQGGGREEQKCFHKCCRGLCVAPPRVARPRGRTFRDGRVRVYRNQFGILVNTRLQPNPCSRSAAVSAAHGVGDPRLQCTQKFFVPHLVNHRCSGTDAPHRSSDAVSRRDGGAPTAGFRFGRVLMGGKHEAQN